MKGKFFGSGVSVLALMVIVLNVAFPRVQVAQAAGGAPPLIGVSIYHSPTGTLLAERPITFQVVVSANVPFSIKQVTIRIENAESDSAGSVSIYHRCSYGSFSNCRAQTALREGVYLYYALVEDYHGITTVSPINTVTILPPQGPSSIRGMLWDLRTGEPLANMEYHLLGSGDEGENVAFVNRIGRTAEDGTFHEENLLPGSYSIWVNTSDYSNAMRIDHSGGELNIRRMSGTNVFQIVAGAIELHSDEERNVWLAFYDRIGPRR